MCVCFFFFSFIPSEASASEDQPFPECSSSPSSTLASAITDNTEQSLLGRILYEETSFLDPLNSIWAGEGGYGKAPGFEREDQVWRTMYVFKEMKSRVCEARLRFIYAYF